MLFIARCIMEMRTLLHCGGDTDGLLDAPVSRDAYGFWRIPGSTVAGVLRTWLREYLGGKAERELFGFEIKNERAGSLVWCSDACLLDYDGTVAWKKVLSGGTPEISAQSFLRDHVNIDQKTGAASMGGKFDEEYVPAGTRFALELRLDGWMQKPSAEEQRAFGAHVGLGYWLFSIRSMDCRSFDLTDEADVNAWLQLDDGPDFRAGEGQPWEPADDTSVLRKEGISGHVTVPFRVTGPILIAGGSPSANVDADMCFATTSVCSYDRKCAESSRTDFSSGDAVGFI